jgi:hypothetical protein
MAKMIPVESSMLKSVGYDAATHVLTVQFKNSAFVHSTLDVPTEVHAELMAADSVGAAYNRLVRGKFTRGSITQVSDDVPTGEAAEATDASA